MNAAIVPLGTILWCTAPGLELEVQLRAMAALSPLAAATGASIQPVYAHAAADGDPLLAERGLADELKAFEEPRLIRPHAEPSPSASTSALVDAVLRYASSIGCDLLCVSTHARVGLRRIVVGSFAETLIARGKGVPILVVNPYDSWREEQIGRILVASELDPGSRDFFFRIAALATAVGATILLFSKTRNRDHDARAARAEEWARECSQTTGVKVDVVIENSKGAIANAIVGQAKRSHCGMIALLTKASPVTAAINHSIARDLARLAPCPIWVEHA